MRTPMQSERNALTLFAPQHTQLESHLRRRLAGERALHVTETLSRYTVATCCLRTSR